MALPPPARRPEAPALHHGPDLWLRGRGGVCARGRGLDAGAAEGLFGEVLSRAEERVGVGGGGIEVGGWTGLG